MRQLCALAGVECRVTGAPADRPLRLSEAPDLRAVRGPGPLAEVWLGVPPGALRARALKALGLLAYGAFDYGARETLRGLPIARPSPGPGRPILGKALSPAERQRRYRERRASTLEGSLNREHLAPPGPRKPPRTTR